MFKRYGEVIARLEHLGAEVGRLNNNERRELQSLLEEQAWLSGTVVKKAKSVLEEVDRSFEKLFDWMIATSDLVDRAGGQNGTPEDIMQLEKLINEAASLRDQLRRLNLDKGVGSGLPGKVVAPPGEIRARDQVEARLEAAPTSAAELAAPLPAPVQTPAPAVKKKIHKKKVKKTGDPNKYSPPQELLAAISQKVSVPNRLRPAINLIEAAGTEKIWLNPDWPVKNK